MIEISLLSNQIHVSRWTKLEEDYNNMNKIYYWEESMLALDGRDNVRDNMRDNMRDNIHLSTGIVYYVFICVFRYYRRSNQTRAEYTTIMNDYKNALINRQSFVIETAIRSNYFMPTLLCEHNLGIYDECSFLVI